MDIGKRLESDEFHRKHNLKLDDQLEMQAATLTSIKEELLRLYDQYFYCKDLTYTYFDLSLVTDQITSLLEAPA